MNEVRLKFTTTEKGVYVYLDTPEKDVLITKVMISRKPDVMLLVDALNLINYRLLAYENFKTALETACNTLKGDGDYEDLHYILKNTLDKFQEPR